MPDVNDAGLFLGLSWIDWAIVVLALGVGLWGWRLGILRAGVALVAIVVGVQLAGMYHENVFIDLAIDESPSGVMQAASFGAILIFVSVVGYVIGTLLRGLASALMLGWADRSAGAVFGVLFGLVLAQAAIAIVVFAGLDDADGQLGESVFGWVMMDNAPLVRALLPAQFDLAIQEFVAEVDTLRTGADDLRSALGGG